MYDLSQESWLRKRKLQDCLVRLFGSYGYRFLEMPILESTELFLRKSGGELASRMYSFIDPGSNPVSLRPEFTSPIVRYYLEHAAEVELPARWQYAGPVFRYEAAHPEGSGQFTQVGAELLGSASIMADVELLSLAAQVPMSLGVNDYRVKLADLEVLHSVLDTVGLSERARGFIIGNVPELREGREAVTALLGRAQQLHLIGYDPEGNNLSSAIAGLDDAQASKVLQGFLHWTGGETPQLGQRDPDEVVQRLLRKLRGSDNQGEMERGLQLIADLAVIQGEPLSALDEARAVVDRAGADPAALERLAQLLDLLLAGPGLQGHLALDFGLARGIAYYNGIIFEVTHPAWEGSLGGGGRYDELARALGSPETVPASGFAYTLETLLALTDRVDSPSSIQGKSWNKDEPEVSPPWVREETGLLTWPSSALVLWEGASNYHHALQATQELRQGGLLAELDVCGKGLSEGLEYAAKKGIAQVVLVDQDGKRTVHKVE
jgi:histidyl-tRNA synthetase